MKGRKPNQRQAIFMNVLSPVELETIVRGIPLAVLVIEKAKGEITYVNENATLLFGSNLKGLLVPSQTDKVLRFLTLTGETFDSDQMPARQALLKGTEVTEEFIIVRPNGTRAVVRGLAKPVRDENGNVIAAVGIYEDITDKKCLEQEMDAERTTLRGIIESTETMIAYLDADFNFVIVNTAYARRSGYSADQLVGKNHFRLFPNVENKRIFERVRDTGKPVTFLDKAFEFANQPKRGVTYWDWTLTPVKDIDETVCGLVLALMETTERKKTEDALRESEERFRLVAEAANVLVYEVHLQQGNVVIVSGEVVLGYKPGQIEGTQDWWLRQIHPDDRENVEDAFSKAIDSGNHYFLEYRIKCKQGNYIIAHDTGRAITNKDGKVTKFVGGMRDVTERKKAEEELRISAERFFKAFDANPAAISISCLTNGLLVDVNETYLRLFGFTRQEVIGKTSTELGIFTAANERNKLVDLLKAQGTVRNLEMSFLTKTKKLINVLISLDKMNANNTDLMISTVTDITERRQLEDKLKEYSKNLEKLVEERTNQLKDSERLAAIGATAGMVGHDIRNPLQAMISDIYLLRTDLESMPECGTKQGVKESLDSIQCNIEYVNKIVSDLQDYTRPLKPNKVPIKVSDEVNYALKNVPFPKNIRLHVNIEEDLVITSDSDYLRRALTNLINNAVQAMPKGGDLTIDAKAHAGKVVFSVKDTGVGIPEDVKPNLFKPLYTTKSKGQGLGLAVVKRLVEGLNGRVTFESKEGNGTKFIIELPKNQ